MSRYKKLLESIGDMDDLKLTITEMKMKEVEANGGFMEEE